MNGTLLAIFPGTYSLGLRAAEFHVSSKGGAGNPGAATRAFATLQQAGDAAPGAPS